MMPGMDGLETLYQLQQAPETQSIPVILLTAKVRSSHRAIYSNLNVAGLIPKPFNAAKLLSQIAAYLNWPLVE